MSFQPSPNAESQGIALNYIQPGKPQQNAYVERYH
jgi:putative transposase